MFFPKTKGIPSIFAEILPVILCAMLVLGQETQQSTIIAGYFPDYRSYIDLNENVSKLLSDVILFSISPTSDGEVDVNATCCLDSTHYATARKAKTFNKGKIG